MKTIGMTSHDFQLVMYMVSPYLQEFSAVGDAIVLGNQRWPRGEFTRHSPRMEARRVTVAPTRIRARRMFGLSQRGQ